MRQFYRRGRAFVSELFIQRKLLSWSFGYSEKIDGSGHLQIWLLANVDILSRAYFLAG